MTYRENPYTAHGERHKSFRIGGLRAAVLGANDGIVSTASLVLGVAAADSDHRAVLVAGAASLVAGAMSMAAGEYVSVHSQTDTEKADLKLEKRELAVIPEAEEDELATIYAERGLEPPLARQVARQLMAHDALGAHARDELGITETSTARPVQAAVFSAISFAAGSALPLMVTYFARGERLIPAVAVSSILFLAVLGSFAAKAGGANMYIGAARVTFWGVLAMAATWLVGAIFGTSAA